MYKLSITIIVHLSASDAVTMTTCARWFTPVCKHHTALGDGSPLVGQGGEALLLNLISHDVRINRRQPRAFSIASWISRCDLHFPLSTSTEFLYLVTHYSATLRDTWRGLAIPVMFSKPSIPVLQPNPATK